MLMGQRDEADKDWTEIIRIKDYDRPYRHKIINGPLSVFTIFYTTEDSEGKPTRTALTVPGYTEHILAELATIDKNIRLKKLEDRFGAGTEKYREEANKVMSAFMPRRAFHCHVIDKADSVPVIRRAEYKGEVRKEIVRLESVKYTDDQGNKDETKLKYGILPMLWFEIERVYADPDKKDSLPIWKNTKYKTWVIEKDCEKIMGKIPTAWLNCAIDADGNYMIIKPKTGKGSKLDVVELGLFTEDQWKVAVENDKNLKNEVAPLSPADALDKLTSNPIMINATDNEGNFLYPSWEEILEGAKGTNIDKFLFKSKNNVLEGRKEKEEKKEEKKETKEETKDEPEEAEFEVVSEEKDGEESGDKDEDFPEWPLV